MKTTKTDEAKSEDDLEEEHRKHVKGVLSVLYCRLSRAVVSSKRDYLSVIRSRVLFLVCRAIEKKRKSNTYLGSRV